MEHFEPKIVCFACNWCTSAGADLAGTSRMEYQPNGIMIRVMCSSRIDPQHILWAFKKGADGVFIGGCHPDDCHYIDGNYNTLRRIKLLKKLLTDFGIEPERLRLEWVSAAEGKKFVMVMDDFIEQIRNMGPLRLSQEASA
ncbi:MAG: hydrogenase iron-sulfur subunit [Candidatus Aminicenantes bacterium]|nr:hydrogenase iron-sulfur subunit [Candidatus Aminicenantes bacterium]